MRAKAQADNVNSNYTNTITVNTPFQTVWYKANENSGTTLNDSFISTHNATLAGAYSFTAGISGNALTLSGGNATLPASIVSGLNDFTIGTWVEPPR